MATVPLPHIRRAIFGDHAITGARLVIAVSTLAFITFLVWASIAQVDEVTSGQGRVIPSSKLQVITAADPATVSEIFVRSGQRVEQGQLLVRLDSPENESQLGQITSETESLQARSSRLTQEGMGGASTCAGGDCAGEQALREARASALRSKLAAVSASAEQRRREAAEAGAMIQSLRGSLAIAQRQVQMMEPLAAKNIVPQTDLLEKRREMVDLQGRIAAAREQQGRAMAAVSEAQAEGSQANFEFRQQALDERSQVNAKIAMNEQSLRGARGKLDRSEVRSPVNGVVNDVQVTTIGGFVQPGQKIMEVVPMGDKLLVETRVRPSDIAFIKVGDRAIVKVTAYDFSTYGGLDGKVVQISADSIYDEVEKEAYFTVIVETDRSHLSVGSRRLPITPGMITDTQIVTGRKSILSYLLKPVLKARNEALRER